jgi:nucleoid-associated protein YgaU
MKQMTVLSLVALAAAVLSGCKPAEKPAPPTPIAPAPAVSESIPEPSGPAIGGGSEIAPPRPVKPLPPEPSKGGAGTVAAGGKTHTVAPHETLYSISVKYYGNGKRVEDIAKLNGITDPNKIQVGQVLKLP